MGGTMSMECLQSMKNRISFGGRRLAEFRRATKFAPLFAGLRISRPRFLLVAKPFPFLNR